jgi:hypothetical protein
MNQSMKISEADRPSATLSRRSAFLLSFAALAFLYLRTFALPIIPFFFDGDEYHYFLHALRILHGQQPYRDFFTFIFPGTDLLYASIFRIAGVHQWVVQAILIVLGFLFYWIVLWISRRIVRTPSAILASLIFLILDFDSALDATHHWWSVFFVMIAVGVLMGGRDRRRIVAVGCLCGVATVFTQTHGTLSVLAIAVYLVWTNLDEKRKSSSFRELLALFAPFAIIVTCVVAYYAHLIGFHVLAYWTIYFPVVFFRAEENSPLAFFRMQPVHGIGDLFSLAPFLLIHLAVPLIYVLSMIRVVRERQSIEWHQWSKILLLTLVGSALFISIMSAPTFLRLCAVAPPAMILCAWYFERSTTLCRWINVTLWSAIVLSALYLPVTRQRHLRKVVNLPTGRVAFINEKEFERTWWLAQHTHPGETFFNEPSAAFDLSLNSPGPLDFITPTEFTRPEQVDALLLSMTAHQTRYIYLYPLLTAPVETKNNLGPFQQYMAKNFHLVQVFSSGQVWERN